MPVLLRIAIRNLIEHKSKTLIIGIIIAVGVVVLVVGNSLMSTAALGIQRGFIDNYTGHIMISGVAEAEISLFGVRSPGGIEDTPTIPSFKEVTEHIESTEGVVAQASQITTFARLGIHEMEGNSFTVLFGVDPEPYRELFDSIIFVEGRDLVPGEEGIVMSVERLEDLEDAIKDETKRITGEEIEFELQPGDEIRLTGFGNAGIKIREVPLRGVFDHRHASEDLGIDLISYVDAQTIRALSGLTIGYRGEFELKDAETELLDTSDLDNLFSDSFTVEDSEEASEDLSEGSLLEILGDTSIRDAALEIDTGAWHFILLRVKNSRRVQRIVTNLNRWFTDNGISAQAGDWEVAAGPFAKTADIIRQVFNVAIIIVGVVALIIMMNTLIISVIERTSEIGTMRALGAQKGFVWRMFLIETITITTVFGAVGVVLALVAIGILNIAGIPATNVFLRVLFAGDALRPSVSVLSMFTSLLIATALGIIAHVYPVTVALRIQPVRAIQTE